ncbi:AlpA family transcriptional regulator [Aureispira sp. CCB-QB1]|uniref:helix-turn-helix transcriptional regulator n=1 Tax=Aureispira sp. CCB-QB1 TaxID=1313421 RepID=UPI0006989714|nr:hypothetical protein [Aureispira sp. CCB-QB1]
MNEEIFELKSLLQELNQKFELIQTNQSINETYIRGYKELATFLNISESKAKQLAKEGNFLKYNLSQRLVFFNKAQIFNWIESKKEQSYEEYLAQMEATY